MANIIKAYLAKQLGHPSGWAGKLVLRLLNRSNETMNRLTFEQLDLASGQQFLEIGFGGGSLIQRCLDSECELKVAGVDPAIAAVIMAERKFQSAMASGNLQIAHAGGEDLPFSDETFDRIATVNTLYFWAEPTVVLRSCWRVLRPTGKLLITYNNKDFLEKTEATNYGFRAYDPAEVESMLGDAGFAEILTVKWESPYDGQFFCTSGAKIV